MLPRTLSFRHLGLVLVLASTQVFAVTTNWTNASGGNWPDSTNWDHGVPTASDTANITLSGTYTVTLDTTGGVSRNVEVLILGGASGTQTLHIQGGTLWALSSVLTCQIRTHGVLDVEGIGQQNGIIYVNSARDSAGVSNSGVIALHANGFLYADSSYIRNDSGAVLYVWDCAVINAPDTRLDNYGTLRTFGLCGTTVYTAIWNYSSGTYTIGYAPEDAAGSQTVQDIHNFGFMEVLSRVQLVMLPIPFDFPNHAATIWNDGTCVLHGGAWIFPHPAWPTAIPSVENHGRMIVDVDTSVVNRTVFIYTHFNQYGGAGNLRVADGSLYMYGYGDSTRFSDSIYVAATCTLSVGSAAFDDSAIVAGAGTVHYYDGPTSARGRWPFSGGFYFTALPNDTTVVSFNPLPPPSVVLSSLNMAMPNTAFLISNTDTVTVSGLHQDGGTISGNVVVTNTYDWTQGTFTADTTAEITIPPGVTLNVTSGGDKTLDSLELIIQGSAVMQDSGIFTLVDSAVVNIASAGTLYVGGGFAMIGVGTFYNSGESTFDPQGDTITINVPVINSTAARTPGTIDIPSSPVILGGGGTNDGTINIVGGGELILDGDYTNDGTVQVAESGTLTINDRLINGVAGQIFLHGGASVMGSGQLDNHGDIESQGSSLLTATNVSFEPTLMNLVDSGWVNVLADTLTLLNGGANQGLITIQFGAVLKIFGTFVNDSSGVINGNGVLDASEAIFINNGTISPGLSPGVLTVNGNLALGESATLFMEIGGPNLPQYDQLVVNGTLQFGGTLALALENGYVPSPNDTLRLLNYTSSAEQFASVTGTAIGNGQYLELTFGPSGLESYVCTGGNAGLSLDSADFTTYVDPANPHDTLRIDLCNTQYCPLEYSVSLVSLTPPSPVWIVVAADDDSGIVTRNNCEQIELPIDVTGVPPEIRSAQLQILSNDPLRPVVQLPLTIYVGVLRPVTHLVIDRVGANMRLTWRAVPEATGYRIYRHDSWPVDPIPSQLVDSVTTTTFNDPNAASAKGFYIVTAVR